MGFDFFVTRPVAAWVVSLFLVLGGFLGWQAMTVRQYPALDKGKVTIETTYYGADSKTIQGYITSIIQKSVVSASGIAYIESISSDGLSRVILHGEAGYDTDKLLTEVITKVAAIRGQLPAGSESPVISKEKDNNNTLMYISFYGKKLSSSQMTDYLQRVVQPQISTIKGVASAAIFGKKTFSMRVWLDPEKMAGYHVSAAQVFNAIRTHNYTATSGTLRGHFTVKSLRVKTDLSDLSAFKAIPIKTLGHRKILLQDIARLELAPEYDDVAVSFNGQTATYIGISPSPTANALDVIRRVRKVLKRDVVPQLPISIHSSIAYDATKFIHAAINEVLKTLIEAVLIVVLVMFLFLGSWRAVIIAVVAIPLSLIGTLLIMHVLDYSINLLTLLAMVLAVGLVVDDAIVVVENIHRHIEEGLSPFDSAVRSAKELATPIIAMTITLLAVYMPLGFVGGLTGILFQEFAFTLAGSVIVSGVVALTLSPMLGSRLMCASKGHRFEQMVDSWFSRLRHRYGRALHAALEAPGALWIAALLILVSLPFLLLSTKAELAPHEDQGVVIMVANPPSYANFDYLTHFTKKFQKIEETIPDYDSSFLINHGKQAFGGLILKPWGHRQQKIKESQTLLQKRLNTITGLQIYAIQPPSLPGGGGNFPVQVVLKTTSDYTTLYHAAKAFSKAAKKTGLFVMTQKGISIDKPQTVVSINRKKAAQMGVSMETIGQTMALFLSGYTINHFILNGYSYRVIAQVDRPYRHNISWLGRYHVPTKTGQMIPLSTLIKTHKEVIPSSLKQFQQMNSATFKAIPAPGVTVGQALDALRKIAHSTLPQNFTIDYAGVSRRFEKEGRALYVTFALALCIIFLVLSAQFESFRAPLIMLVTVPLALSGALIPLALWIATMNIYTQIGMITLIGLISKHGILIVQFANHFHQQGLSLRESIERASTLRLRAVLMTTVAAVVAMVPLLISSGAGAQSRFDIGLVIASGMTVGTLFTLFVVPAFYLLISRDKTKAQAVS